MKTRFTFLLAVLAVLFILHPSPAVCQSPSVTGTVRDQSGGAIAGARLELTRPNGSIARILLADQEGIFSIELSPGESLDLVLSARGFETRRVKLDKYPLGSSITVTLGPEPVREEVTVTAERGSTTGTAAAAAVVSVYRRENLLSRPLPTIGNILEGAAGTHVQQSTHGQVSPFLRGLTGYQTLNLVDGIRFNNTTFRSGPNQYLAFIEPSQTDQVETMLGPSSSQYGSDSLGGTIQILTVEPEFGIKAGSQLNGTIQMFGATADRSFGTNASVGHGTERVAILAGGTFRRHNDLRAGDGADSHHVFNRFMGLSDEVIRSIYGQTLQDTGFSQYGFYGKLLARLGRTQNLSVWYQQNRIDGVRGYKDLWGGLGRLRSEFTPQDLQFFYSRYEKFDLGPLDSFTATFSLNSQRDGSVRQGLTSLDKIIRDETLVNAFGYSVQAKVSLGSRQRIVFGGEIYYELIDATRTETDPRTNLTAEKRALYPNGSRYTTYGLFLQDKIDIIPNRLWANVGARFTRVGSRTYADRNTDQSGNPLGVINSSQTFNDLTYNAGFSWMPTHFLTLHFLTGRGFRAPNLNDLGALGLNDLGFEVPADSAISNGGLLGTGDGEGVGTNGKSVSTLKAEQLFNYEFGVTLRTRRLYSRVQFFDAELRNPIVRRTLLFPVASVPTTLAGLAVVPIPQTAIQLAQGVISVATALDPRAVKAFANDGSARYYGIDTRVRYELRRDLSFEGSYSILKGRELNPNRNIRRLPPSQGSIVLRYAPETSRFRLIHIEMSVLLSGPQTRFSGGDITDERIGAARSRRDISSFLAGTIVRPYLTAGSDGIIGTIDDIFVPTNETVAAIRNRVLPVGSTINGITIVNDDTRAPLYTRTKGFATTSIRTGFSLSKNTQLDLGLFNILDQNYRTHGSGTDAAGINLWMGIRFKL